MCLLAYVALSTVVERQNGIITCTQTMLCEAAIVHSSYAISVVETVLLIFLINYRPVLS